MNALQQAATDINELNRLSGLCAEARAAFEHRRTTPPVDDCTAKHTILHAGKGMVRIVDNSTGKVVGFRQSHKEAIWLAQQLENGMQVTS
ncbi:hypothetical protein ACIGCM_03760 [Pseudomonas sp. NPDC078700]|uniref:hypothetical protein n=1 Tax=Pseudomonas sp. NPDC078700 TaxID=3364424 RepID=UPI0037CBAE4C